MRVLAFGHIPISEGGRQSSGLANVIYQLAYNGAKQKGVEMTLAATDVFVHELKKGDLTILGWTRTILVRHALLHIGTTLRILINTVTAKIKYSSLVSVPGLLLKSIFLDYAIKKVRPDVVHMHGAHSLYYHPVLPQNIKLVVTLHGNVGNDNNLSHRIIHEKVERSLCLSSRIDMLCTISSMIPIILKGMYGEIKPRHQVILNAYDNKVFKFIEPQKHDKLTLFTIASFSRLKGQERVIKALQTSHCDYGYRCIGYISEKDNNLLEKKANGIDFQWLGVKAPVEIRELLAGADYMILPSSSEGFGLVYLEAIACGVPVIIPDNLPLALEGDIINEKNAIRLKGCDVEAIVAILPGLAHKSWNRHEISQSVSSYSWDCVAKEYNIVYSSI